ncbi:MAG: hypothetical protein HYT93_00690 [Parcubacteria group bacterium]|nr:hypothetical protein [Parcubacteria group bacterium]
MTKILSLALHRVIRRVGVNILVCVVLLNMALGWVLDRLHEATHALIQALGLKHLEDWLRRQPLWFPVMLMVCMVVGYVAFNIYELALLLNKQIILALVLSTIFKVVYLGIFNYLMHIYSEQFLGIWWIRKLYERYQAIRAFVLNYIKQQPWYTRAVIIKNMIKDRAKEFLKTSPMFALAKRLLRRKSSEV